MTAGDAAAPPPPRAVLDTSVLFCQHRHWLWLLAVLGYFEGVWSTLVVGELVRVRVEHRIARGVERAVYRQRVNDRIHALSDVFAVADYRRAATSASLRDPDDPTLAAALAASAEYVVSLNTRNFPADETVAGVRFLTPNAFPAELAARFPTADPPIRAARADRQAR